MRFDRRLLRLGWIVVALIVIAGTAYPQFAPISLFPAPPPGPPVPLGDGVLNQAYFGGVFENNFVGPTIWSITSGSLPPGITATPSGSTYSFSGSPKLAGLFVFPVQANDTGAGQIVTQQYSINVELPLTITTPLTLPSATAGYNYSVVFTAINGTSPYAWNEGLPPGLTFGKTSTQRGVTTSQRGLPAGLTLSSSGSVTGAPTQAGAYSIVISAVDSGIQSATSTFAFVVNPPPSVPAATLPDGVTGTKYAAPLTAQNGTTPYFWTVNSGVLPPGLTILPAGTLSGTPTKAGTYLFAAQVTDARGAAAVGAVTVTITQGLGITTASPLPNGAVGSAYKLPFAGAGVSPLAWSVTGGSLPPGFTLDPATGILSGTPTVATTYGFTVQVTDSTKTSVSKNYTLTIQPQLIITTTSLANGQIGTAYAQTLAATGGTPPYLWALTGTAGLPPGLALNRSTGAITGTPVQNGASKFTVQVTDSAGIVTTQPLSLAIGPVITFTTPSPLQPNAVVGQPYSQSIAVTGGTQPYTFSQTGLSDGITLDSTGKLAGTPQTLSVLSFTVTVTDVNQVSATQPYLLAVVAPTLPAPTIGGVTDNEPPAQQPGLSLQLANSYPLPLTGTITLTFASTVGNIDDPAIQFSTGGRTANFTVPAGSTIPAQAPVITKVAARHTAGGIEVDVTGFSNSRDMASAAFQFQASAGTSLQTSQVTVQVDPIFGTWYSDATSQQFGSQFTFTQPFTISGNGAGITDVSVTLTNKEGASSAVSASVQ